MSNDLLTFPQASRELAGRPHVSTIHRWRLAGVRGCKLQTVLVGGRRFVSRESLDLFIAATTAVANGDPPPVRTDKQRERAIDAAERELDAIGV